MESPIETYLMPSRKLIWSFLDHPNGSVMKSMKVSIDSLREKDAGCYKDLAVFPSDEAVPQSAVAMLWMNSQNLKERDANKLIIDLERKALIRRSGGEASPKIELHDIQHDYLRAVQSDMPRLHKKFLDAYASKRSSCRSGVPSDKSSCWPTIPDDGYFFQHLTYHLNKAGMKDDLRNLLFNFRWMQAKLDATDVNALISDYRYIEQDEDLDLVQGAIRLSAHIISLGKDQLKSQLIGRLIGHNSFRIKAMLDEIRQEKSFPWLCPLTPSLFPSGGPMIRTFQGHNGSVRAVSIIPDDLRVISASNDNTLKIWDLENVQEIRTYPSSELTRKV